MPPPQFSIIIPVYNVAPYLRECLDSVLAQTYKDWEAICVDDGSTDGSGAILDEYAARDKRFLVIHQSNAGVGATRNRAIDVALGEWVVFLDADDLWDAALLKIIAEESVLVSSDTLIRFGFAVFHDLDRPVFARQVLPFRDIDIRSSISYEDFFSWYFWCYAYRRSEIGDTRFPSYIRGEDRIFLNAIMLKRARTIHATNTILHGYRQRNGSAMNKRPSVQVLKDELSHRVDLMEMIDRSGKVVCYRGVTCLEDFCTRQFLYIVELTGGYNRVERRNLVQWFYYEYRRISNARQLSNLSRLRLCLVYCFRSWVSRLLVTWYLPLLFYRLKLLFFHPVLIVRKLRKRICHGE